MEHGDVGGVACETQSRPARVALLLNPAACAPLRSRTISGGEAVANSVWRRGELVVSIVDAKALVGAAQVERHFVNAEGKLKIEVVVELPPAHYTKTYRRA